MDDLMERERSKYSIRNTYQARSIYNNPSDKLMR
jgi:hypothetical protein